MADLLDRMLGYLDPNESNLAVAPEVIIAAMYEFDRSNLTETQIRTSLALTQEDWDGLVFVYGEIFTNFTYDIEEFRNLFTLGGTRNRSSTFGIPYYDKTTVMTRLGL